MRQLGGKGFICLNQVKCLNPHPCFLQYLFGGSHRPDAQLLCLFLAHHHNSRGPVIDAGSVSS